MARGWESKSVEDQISQHEELSEKKKADRQDVERKTKREGIMLVRSRTLTALENTRDDRYKKLLEHTLSYLDSELTKLAG